MRIDNWKVCKRASIILRIIAADAYILRKVTTAVVPLIIFDGVLIQIDKMRNMA